MILNPHSLNQQSISIVLLVLQNHRFSSKIQWQTAEVQRILGHAPEGKFSQKENETIHNEKLLKLAFSVSELTFLQAKHQILEERLQSATEKNESHAVIEV